MRISRFIAACLLVGGIGAVELAAQSNEPIRPLGDDGKPLNLDFETGTLKDWHATGDAFDDQPVRGDTVHPRRDTSWSRHQGEYWIGGFEKHGDDGTGTLTSVPFKVTHRWGSFLIGGGSWPETRVEIVESPGDRIVFQSTGADSEDLRPVVVDLQKLMDHRIYIRLVDGKKGAWGHINFDNFVFYDQRPTFANELDPSATTNLKPDVYKYAGIPGELAAQVMTMPEGFKAHLYAQEPDIVNPIAFTIDERGRLWVVEGLTYPQRAKEGMGNDRIFIFEDTKGDGHFTKRTTFMDGLNLVSGIEVGFGGVWVGAAPYLLYIPIDASGDKPAGPPQILLDGFGYQDTHETLNTFAWGPDGWLYGNQGVFTKSYVGKPGTPRNERTFIDAGIWRYHPTKHIFERFAEGTSNSWGIDWDDHGQCIIEACVIPHLWHIIQGAHYLRQAGQHDDPYVYDDIKTIADHVHWAKAPNPWAANGKSDAAGGGHAHAGMMVYLGGSWPQQFVGQYFMNNIHGARINMDIPEAKGSSFVGHHGKDFILFNDLFSQIVNLRYDQDGSVYMIDWYDRNQCHSPNPAVHDFTTGRIFKIVYGNTPTTQIDLRKMDDMELAKLQLDKHEWRGREARRVLQERADAGILDPSAKTELIEILRKNPDESRKLRALWALHCVNGISQDVAMELLKGDQPYVTAWTIQFLCEDKHPSNEAVREFARLAKESPSPVVRLYLASACQRMPAEQTWDILAGLLSHPEDAKDHNLPLMDWYAMEAPCAADPDRALAMASNTEVPNILSFTARRIGSMNGNATDKLVTALSHVTDGQKQLDLLTGIRDSLRGRRSVEMPDGWKALEPTLAQSSDVQVQKESRALAVTFGSESAIDQMRKIASDTGAKPADRNDAIESLLGIKDSKLPAQLQDLLGDSAVRETALRGLGTYDDPKTASAILSHYDSYDQQEKKDALITLSSRTEYAKELVAAVQAGKVSSKDFSADIVRQLRTLSDPDLDQQVAKVWGILRDSPADKKARIEQVRRIVEARGKAPSMPHGRVLFAKTCMQCHTLYETGGHVGPDLTGSNRGDLSYLLENMVDPNAIIPNDYRSSIIQTTDGRTIVGIVKKEDDKSITVVMPNEDLLIPKNEIKRRKLSELSMMPEGILDNFSNSDIRDLVAYLRNPNQVPLPPGAEEELKAAGAPTGK